MRRSESSSLLAIAAAGLLAAIVPQYAIAAQKPEYPKVTAEYRQSPEDQQKDIAECYEIAKTRTGIDPAELNQADKSNASDSSKTAQNVPAEADSAASAAADRAANTPKEQPIDTFRRANEACLKARGYIVNKTNSKGSAPSPEKP